MSTISHISQAKSDLIVLLILATMIVYGALSRALIRPNIYLMARFNKQNSSQQAPALDQTVRIRQNKQTSYLGNVRKLIKYCSVEDKDSCDDLTNEEFFGSAHDPRKMINQVLPLQMSYNYYFRDYPALLMSLQNLQKYQIKLSYEISPQQFGLTKIRKIFALILSDKQKLALYLKHIEKNAALKKEFDNIVTAYAKGLGYLVSGDIDKGQSMLVSILNKISTSSHSNQSEIELNLKSKSVSLKQKILFNLLIVRSFLDSQRPPTRLTAPLDLYNKIKKFTRMSKDKQVSAFIVEQFSLTDYEQFLNIWLSSKYDQPLQWVDLPKQSLAPYEKYLYLLAENSYIKKDRHRTEHILGYLPKEHPLRNFTQISMLYDDQNYEQLHKKCEKFISNKLSPYTRCPEYDLVYHNIMKVARKAASNQQDEDLQAGLLEETIIFKNKLNIDTEPISKGIPHYYLSIPFEEVLVIPEMSSSIRTA